MALDRNEVEKIAHLARIALNEEDIPATTAKLIATPIRPSPQRLTRACTWCPELLNNVIA